MAIYIGNNSLTAAKLGTTNLTSIWLGAIKIWPTTPPSYKFQATYLGGSVYSLECDEYDDITYFDAHPQGYEPSAMTEAYIGDCVKTVGNQCFHQNKSLSSVTISSGVTSLGESCFSYCTSLEYIDIPSTVEVLGRQCFFNSSGLTSIDLEEGLTTIGQGCFEQCVSLSSLTIPSTVTVIGRQAFNSCTSLESLTVLATTPPTISGSNTFQYTDCPIYVPCESLDDYKTASYWQDVASRIQPIQGTCPKLMAKYSNGDKYIKACDGNTTLSNGETKPSGYEYTAMTEAVVGDCVNTLGRTCFNSFSNLSSVTLSDSITTFNDYVFYQCGNLESVKMPSGLTSVGRAAFYRCYKLRTIDIPNSLTSIGMEMFYECRSLPSVTIPSGVTSIGHSAFYGCSSLPSITIPSGVTSIDVQAFAHCSSLPSITIPSGITSIAWGVFNGCSSLSSFTIPSGVTSIDNYAFNGCSSLSSITIPSGVTRIGGNAFADCTSLSSITIPSGITSIGGNAFANCSSLQSVTIEATTPPTLGNNVFNYTNNCPIYVPCESVDAYKAANNWSSYASRIQPIPDSCVSCTWTYFPSTPPNNYIKGVRISEGTVGLEGEFLNCEDDDGNAIYIAYDPLDDSWFITYPIGSEGITFTDGIAEIMFEDYDVGDAQVQNNVMPFACDLCVVS